MPRNQRYVAVGVCRYPGRRGKSYRLASFDAPSEDAAMDAAVEMGWERANTDVFTSEGWYDLAADLCSGRASYIVRKE